MVFTARSYLAHSGAFAHAHSLEAYVCENDSVFGESADGSARPSARRSLRSNRRVRE
jgi:hypothetical protein